MSIRTRTHSAWPCSIAFKDAMGRGARVLLEPMRKVRLQRQKNSRANVTGDLTARRGMVQGMDEIPGSGGKLIAALVPLADMFGYSTTLRSLTQGRGNLFDGVQALRRGTGPRPRAGRGVGKGRALAAEGPPAETAYRASEPPSTERIAPVV
jgi:hypothetical protein